MLRRPLSRSLPVVASASPGAPYPRPVPQRMPSARLREHADMWGSKAAEAEGWGLVCTGVAFAAQAAQYAIMGKQVYDGCMELPMRTAGLSRRAALMEVGKYMVPILGVMGAQAVAQNQLRRKAVQLGAKADVYRSLHREVMADVRAQELQEQRRA